RLGKCPELAPHAVAAPDEGLEVAAGQGGPEVGTAAEDLVAGPGDDDGPYAVIVAYRVQRVVQLVDQGLADRVGRWSIERDDRIRLLARERERFKSHRVSLL